MLDPAGLPRFSTRAALAELLGKQGFQVSPRSLERWPARWRTVNGRAMCETAEGFKIAQTMIDAAPAIRGGNRSNQPAEIISETAAHA